MSLETLSAAVTAYLNLIGSGTGSQEQRDELIRAMVVELEASYIPEEH